MSEHTPITGNLRGRMNTLGWYDKDGSIVCTTGGEPASEIASLVINSKTFGELCDAIDAIHANLERENAELKAEIDSVTVEQEKAIQQALMGEGGVLATDENMAEHGWVRGPLDKDGKMWRSGDMSDSNWGVIEGIAYGNGRWLVRGHDTSAPWISADSIRHHHAQTVEDVLREFALDVCKDDALTIREGVVEEYAAKLRLAEEVDA